MSNSNREIVLIGVGEIGGAQLQQTISGQTLDAKALMQAMVEAFAGDPQNKCLGRSAPARLERALTRPQLSNLANYQTVH
ncbi:MAG: hypothetical protein P8163_14955 [Candidatus Thiodiazotropha sp.]